MAHFEAFALIFVICAVIEALVVGGFFGILKLLKIIKKHRLKRRAVLHKR